MSKKLAKILKTDVLENLPSLAKIVQSKGRRGDTVLAHISRREAEMLKRRGGSGTINPDTGLPEFFEDFGIDTYTPMTFDTPVEAPVSLPTFAQEPAYTSPTYYGGESPGTVSGYGSSQGTFASPTGLGYDVPYASEFAGGLGAQTQASPYDVAGGGFDFGRLFGGGQGNIPTGVIPGSGIVGEAQPNVPIPPVRPGEEGPAVQTAEYTPSAGTGETEKQAAEDKGIFGKLGLGDLAKLGIGGIGALMGRQQQQQALKQAQALQAQYAANAAAAAQQQKELAAPLLTPGYSALAQANQGTLTAANQQAFQAMQARLAQSQARSGGVGAIQTAVAEEAARQQALSNQITQAMQLIGPGNTLANQAIQTNLLGQQGGLQLGISLSQQANQAAMNMYGALAKFVAG
jgi:hypothetical protein